MRLGWRWTRCRWSRHFRNFPGQGDLDVEGFVRAVLASGYSGPLSLEIFNDEFRAAPARLIARDGLRSLILVEAQAGGAGLARRRRCSTASSSWSSRWTRTRAGGLASMLRSVGFRHAGQHRSKSVDLYRQGRDQLRAEHRAGQRGASEHFQLHGPSVCAMALRVDDARAALIRARALLCSEWHERIGDGRAAHSGSAGAGRHADLSGRSPIRPGARF